MVFSRLLVPKVTQFFFDPLRTRSEIFGGGLAFCGVSSTPEIFIFIEFLGHFFGLWGFIKAKIFRKFSNKVRKFSKIDNFSKKRPILDLFCPKMPFLGSKTLFFFSKFRRLRRRNLGFHRPPSAAEVWN